MSLSPAPSPQTLLKCASPQSDPRCRSSPLRPPGQSNDHLPKREHAPPFIILQVYTMHHEDPDDGLNLLKRRRDRSIVFLRNRQNNGARVPRHAARHLVAVVLREQNGRVLFIAGDQHPERVFAVGRVRGNGRHMARREAGPASQLVRLVQLRRQPFRDEVVPGNSRGARGLRGD